jgi:twinkle protein
MKDIVPQDRSSIVSFPSGFKELDKKIIGFNLGEVSLWSGLNASGKSSVLEQISLNCVERGFRVA